MSDPGDSVKYKWTPDATSLLVSVWSDRQVQKQFEYAAKPQIIWESVARYMGKKGYSVSGKQCRSRIKQVLVCYREAKRAGTRAGVEQYYESIDRVLKNKKMDEDNVNGIDTVDATANVRSPPKDVKTNKNMQVRHKYQEPVQSLCRTEALSPTWMVGRENEYPDSPESNETIIPKTYNAFSPTRDVAINTGDQISQVAGKPVQYGVPSMDEPLRANYKQNLLASYPYGEVPFQNAVQNVQNQIIQENMQQYQNVQQNRMWNPQNQLPNNIGFQQNMQNLNQCYSNQPVNMMHPNVMHMQNPNYENVMLHQNQLQQTAPLNNRAMPQEPRKIICAQNLASYKQYRDTIPPRMVPTSDKQIGGSLSPDYSPDVSQNLNDAFCQSKGEAKTHSLNETFSQPLQSANPSVPLQPDVSVVTNNATYNDDSLLLDMMLESPTPSDNYMKSKETGVNTEDMPDVPIRKKKAQKLEQLVLSAINSQNEVVNKILAAQNDMVSRFLDIDRDRQNRLENRLDDLLKVVHATVLNKAGDTDSETEIPAPPPDPAITALVPPPKPGTVPPKLDLVPPKPCRVPCTMPSSNIELINQNPVSTRPGIVSPIMSPSKKPGTIWSKLGPVSQSPFVKAQQRLGIQPILASETRTQSSAERRIAREVGGTGMDLGTIIFETSRLIEMEKQLEEKIENARRELRMGQHLTARRKLFTQREPTPAMILTAAFLEAECCMAEQLMIGENVRSVGRGNSRNVREDDMLAGQGESYERLRRLNVQPVYVAPEPCDTSTPAKLGCNNDGAETQRQSIQQLARLVMNSARWKEAASVPNQQCNIGALPQPGYQMDQDCRPLAYNGTYGGQRSNAVPYRPMDEIKKEEQKPDQAWPQNTRGVPTNEQKAGYGQMAGNAGPPPKPKFPIGFTTTMLDAERPKEKDGNVEFGKAIGFTENVRPDRKQLNVRFMDEALAELQRMYIERTSKDEQERNDSLPYVTCNGNNLSAHSRQMIEQYMQELMPKKLSKDTDSENDEEFLDTTATMQAAVVPRRGSLTSNGTGSTETAQSMKFFKTDNNNCVIS